MTADHCHWIVTALAVLGHVLHWVRYNWHNQEIADLGADLRYFTDDVKRRIADHETKLGAVGELAALAAQKPSEPRKPGRPHKT